MPYLAPESTFAAPCVGAGDLATHLQSAGHVCVFASDIEPRCEAPAIDALSPDAERFLRAVNPEYVIENPPWDRKILHPMIERFSSIAPTWLLIDADWMHTRQSAPYMKLCRQIVSVGRFKWIPDSKMTGKDNAAWYLFDANDHYEWPAPLFYGRTER